MIEKIWYQQHPLRFALLPISLIYCALVLIRKWCYQLGYLQQIELPVPVIVVGNITVGGTGKTPLVQNLVSYLTKQGYTPGVISRGYGGKSKQWPQSVTENSDPELVGDEPVLIAKQCRCSIAVGPDRIASAQLLLANSDCNIIISDDGLQHYRLARTIEIAVIDGQRQLGNGFCLPAGPLRERSSRLNQVDYIVVNGGQWPNAHLTTFAMTLEQDTIISCADSSKRKTLAYFESKTVHAIAGIGNPQRFFNQLIESGIRVIPHAYPDHFVYQESDMEFNDTLPILMTDKDAIKCSRFQTSTLDNCWRVSVNAILEDDFYQQLSPKLKSLQK